MGARERAGAQGPGSRQARLKLPQQMPRHEKMQRVEEILTELVRRAAPARAGCAHAGAEPPVALASARTACAAGGHMGWAAPVAGPVRAVARWYCQRATARKYCQRVTRPPVLSCVHGRCPLQDNKRGQAAHPAHAAWQARARRSSARRGGRAQDLQHCKHTRIGLDIDGAVSGISGGERRRVSVGIGLVTDARVLFLDEPTTGLDSESAEALIGLLSGLAAAKRRTVRARPRPGEQALVDLGGR